ncbi:hypothetical protein D9613_007597 [Agrocybe pediades]|uniref:Uncharacterized protein n=1 Tax=Agrocybe pediades TaxID=84607 RepID=A0A8H4VKS8_9AGAR|nr:hypothetical protein D9613_007597 [Agrocybe pediades]
MPITTRSKSKSRSIKADPEGVELKHEFDTDVDEEMADSRSTPKTRSMTRKTGSSTPTATNRVQRKPVTTSVRRSSRAAEGGKSRGKDVEAEQPSIPGIPSKRQTRRKAAGKEKAKENPIDAEITGDPFVDFNTETQFQTSPKIANVEDRPSTQSIAFNRGILFRRPASLLSIPLIIILLACLLEYTRRYIAPTNAISAHICAIPGISRTPFCHTKPTPAIDDFPSLMNLQTRCLEDLANQWVVGSTLPLEMKAQEMAVKDLATLVTGSDLKKERNALASSLRKFATEIKWTGRGLQKLNSRIQGAFGNVMAMSEYAFHSLEHAANEDYNPAWLLPKKSADALSLPLFEKSMDKLSVTAKSLMSEADINIRNLKLLEERLVEIFDAAVVKKNSADKDRILAELWEKLADQGKIRRDSDSGRVVALQEIKETREKALRQVLGVANAVWTLNRGLDDLRNQTAVRTEKVQAPLNVQIGSIRRGLERLQSIQSAAKVSERENLKLALSMYGSGDDGD